MKSVYCRVAKCYNVMVKDGPKFFTFPRDPTLCEQWVLYCQCSQTSEWFYTGGVFALKKHSICANHFDPTAFDLSGTRLIPGAVPGQRYGPVEDAEPQEEDSEGEQELEEVKQEELEDSEVILLNADQIPVLVEMLSPEEIKEELDEFEEVEPLFVEELPPIEEVIKLQHQSDCIFATGKVSNFEERYKSQVIRNRNMECLIEKAKLKYAQKAEQLRKLNDLLANKRRRKQKLQRKLHEYKRRGPAALVKSVELATKDKSCNNDSDSSEDDANAWW